MNAREELFGRICAHTGLSDLEANDLIDAYAHELAERIRALGVTPSGHPSYDEGRDAGRDLAADLIDPEVGL